MRKVLSSLAFLVTLQCSLVAQVIVPSSDNIIRAPASLEGTVAKDYIVVGQRNLSVESDTKNKAPQLQAAPSNDNCSNAVTLIVDAGCVSGTTRQSSTESGENFDCQGSPNQSVWYNFVATNSSMYVEVEFTSSSGCYFGSAVWSDACVPSNVLSCVSVAAGLPLQVHSLTGLTVGNTYYIQVTYLKGSSCGSSFNAGADFCIDVGTTVICNSCDNTCGTLCIFGSQPTVSDVTSTCTSYTLKPRIIAGQSETQCYPFTANSTTFNLQMVIQSVGCLGGNVITFDWTLQDAGCGTALQSGDLSNLNATGLTIGENYILCYTWVAACEHDYVWPYIVSNVPLPIELVDFYGTYETDHVELDWSTASETNNNYFTVERSADGTNFEKIGQVTGAGNSSQLINYSFNDDEPLTGISYYRLQQTDYDGKQSDSRTIAVNSEGKDLVHILPNPVNSWLYISVNASSDTYLSMSVCNVLGQQVYLKNTRLSAGSNQFNIDATGLSKGAYFLRLEYNAKITSKLIMKE